MENIQHLFAEAGTLLFAGMVFVFAFLSLLIVFINVVLVSLSKKYPDAIAPVKSSSKKTRKDKGVSPAVVAAISSAVQQYRQKHNKEQ